MKHNHYIIVRSSKDGKIINESTYSPETSLNFIKAKIKEETSVGLKFEIICRSDFVIEEI